MSERAYVIDWNWVNPERAPTMTVHELEDGPPRFTGVLNAQGQRIMAVQNREPIGFVKFTVR